MISLAPSLGELDTASPESEMMAENDRSPSQADADGEVQIVDADVQEEMCPRCSRPHFDLALRP